MTDLDRGRDGSRSDDSCNDDPVDGDDRGDRLELEDGPARTQPALRTLQVDQRELLIGGTTVTHGLRDGFPTLRAALEWYQRAAIRTLGAIAREFPPDDLVRDRSLTASLVVGRERDMLADDPPSLEAAAEFRDRLERQIVHPACIVSFDRLRVAAGEYIGDDGGVSPDQVDPADQDHVAMRPSFSRKDVEQATALRDLWGGFDRYHALMDWLHDLLEPSNGAIPDDLASEIGRDPVARAHLVRNERGELDERAARRWRERFTGLVVLPAFVRGIERMEGGEYVKQRSTGLSAPQG